MCAALSLPYPSDASVSDSVDVDKGVAEANARNLEQNVMNKLLLVGCDQSGTSTLFKQVDHHWWNFSLSFCLVCLLFRCARCSAFAYHLHLRLDSENVLNAALGSLIASPVSLMFAHLK